MTDVMECKCGHAGLVHVELQIDPRKFCVVSACPCWNFKGENRAMNTEIEIEPTLPAGFVIEQGIPIPDPSRRGAPKKYAFELMSIGDSVLIRNTSRTAIVSSLSRFTSTMHFVTRKVPDGFRVWRTA